MRAYVAPLGLWLTLDAGTFASVDVNTRTHVVRITLSPQTPDTQQARLHVEQPAKVTGVGTYRPRLQLTTERDAYAIPLKRTTTWIELIDSK